MQLNQLSTNQIKKTLPVGLAGLAIFATGYAIGNRGKEQNAQLRLPMELAPPRWTEPSPDHEAPEADAEQTSAAAPGQLALFDSDPADGLESSELGPVLANMRSTGLGMGMGQGSQ